MTISEEDVRAIAALARLDVPDERLPHVAAELGAILEHMQALQQVDTEGVPGAAGVSSGGTPLRVDEGPPIPLLREPEAFAPAMREHFFVVPRLASHGESASPDPAGSGAP